MNFANYSAIDICRVCQSADTAIDLTKNKGIVRKLRACADIEYDQNDFLPKKLCKLCMKSLDLSYKFKIKCEYADQKFREIIEFLDVKKEITIIDDSEFEKEIEDQQEIEKECTFEKRTTIQDEPIIIDDPSIEEEAINENEPTIEVGPSINQLPVIADKPSKIESSLINSGIAILEESVLHEQEQFELNFEPTKFKKESNTRTSINEEQVYGQVKESQISPTQNAIDVDQELNAASIIVELNGVEFDEYTDNCFVDKFVSKEEEKETLMEKNDIKTTAIINTDDIIIEEDTEIQLGELIYYDEGEVNEDNFEHDIIVYEGNEEDDEQSVSSSTKQSKLKDAATTANRLRQFKCDTCGMEMCNFIEFNRHKKMHGNNRYQCPICDRWFSKRYHMKNHLAIHRAEKKYNCEQCDKKYTNQGNLDRHVRVFHNKVKSHICDKCGKGFSQSTILRQHNAVHNEERNFQCNICHKYYKTIEYLTIHKTQHLPPEQRPTRSYPRKKKKKPVIIKAVKKEFVCTYCSKVCSSHASYRNHIRIHTGEKPFECFDCKKRFSFHQSLRNHTLLHTGEKPFKCDICDMTFRQIGHLKGHQLVHTGIRQYTCTKCNKSFALRSNLTVHMRLHTGETPYHCNFCPKQFYDSNGLRRHRDIHIRKQAAESAAAALVLQQSISEKSTTENYTEVQLTELGHDETLLVSGNDTIVETIIQYTQDECTGASTTGTGEMQQIFLGKENSI